MKKATLIVWVIILGIIALVIFQNQTFFMTHHALRFNLGVVSGALPPNLPIAVVFIFFFFCGLVIAYLFGLSSRFKARRTIKKLNATIMSQKNEAAELQRELKTLKEKETTAVQQAAETKTGTDEIIELTGDRLVENPADRQDANPAKDSKDKNNK
jgi:hypothetical protein